MKHLLGAVRLRLMQQLMKNDIDNSVTTNDLEPESEDTLFIEIENFEGPLDLLSYLVKKNKFNILDIPINELINQYIIYLDSIKKQKIDIISDYLLMLSELIEIKSKMLLPRSKRSDEEVDENNLRKKLAEKLKTYKTFRKMALKFQNIAENKPPIAKASTEHLFDKEDDNDVDFLVAPTVSDLVGCYKNIVERNSYDESIKFRKEKFSVNNRKIKISNAIYKSKNNKKLEFKDLYENKEGRAGVVVSFLAILDMVKENIVDVNIKDGKVFVENKF